MKKILQKKPCYDLIVNDKYICIIGNQLNVYSRINYDFICSFSDMSHYNHGSFLDNFFISKNTSGKYGIYNIKQKTKDGMFTIPHIKAPQDSAFLLSANNKYVFDVLSSENYIYDDLCKVKVKGEVFYKIDVQTGKNEKVSLNNWGVIKNIFDDNVNKKALLMLIGATGNINSVHNCVCRIIAIDYLNMKCENIYEHLIPTNNKPILFFQGKYILYENMEVVDIETNNIVKVVNYAFQRMSYGYFIKAFFSNIYTNYLLFIFSEKVVIFDYLKGEVVKEFEEKYCSTAEIIDDKVFIGTWEKVLIFDLEDDR